MEITHDERPPNAVFNELMKSRAMWVINSENEDAGSIAMLAAGFADPYSRTWDFDLYEMSDNIGLSRQRIRYCLRRLKHLGVITDFDDTSCTVASSRELRAVARRKGIARHTPIPED